MIFYIDYYKGFTVCRRSVTKSHNLKNLLYRQLDLANLKKKERKKLKVNSNLHHPTAYCCSNN